MILCTDQVCPPSACMVSTARARSRLGARARVPLVLAGGWPAGHARVECICMRRSSCVRAAPGARCRWSETRAALNRQRRAQHYAARRSWLPEKVPVRRSACLLPAGCAALKAGGGSAHRVDEGGVWAARTELHICRARMTASTSAA